MKVSFSLAEFRCEKKFVPFAEQVLEGEYDIPLSFTYRPRVLDLGANVGAFSIWATHKWPGCEIFAYEPHPKNVALLVKNLKNYDNVVVNPVGVGTPGLRPLYEGKYNCGEHSFYRMANNPAASGQHVRVIDPLELPAADILKMDIEGCEIEVLPPLLTDGRKFSAILFEYHNDEIRRQLDALLTDYVLIASNTYVVGRGTLRYMHKDIL